MLRFLQMLSSAQPPMRAIKCGMAIRKPTRPRKITTSEQAKTMKNGPSMLNGWAVSVSRAVMISGETGFHVANQPAKPSVRGGYTTGVSSIQKPETIGTTRLTSP